MEKKLIGGLFAIFILIAFEYSFFLDIVHADPAGQIPFLKINGTYTMLYPVVAASSLPSSQFNVPQNSAPANYLVNHPLSFELDKNLFPLNKAVIDTAGFDWNFGDGTTGTGLKQAHTYAKMGSYILMIHIKNTQAFVSPDPSDPSLFESVLINVLPNPDYQLPQAIIKADNKGAEDRLWNSIQLDFSQKIQMDGSKSKAGSAPIISYFWDFSDNRSDTKATTLHLFDKTLMQAFPILRVTDANGFMADTFIELDNTLILYDKGHQTLDKSLQAALKQQNIPQNPIVNTSLKLNDLLKRLTSQVFQHNAINYQLLLIVFVFAFFAGSLHALTPGHGKSLMAALLIGKDGSKIVDVLIIALSLTFAHTIVIYLLGFTLLFINLYYPINNLIPYFSKASALLVIFIALYLIRQGYLNYKHTRDHQHGHAHVHHEKQRNQKTGRRVELFLAGASGGLVPCIDALALLILAVDINQILYGLLVVFIFSLGLATSIIVLGVVLVFGKNKLHLERRIGGFAEIYGPMIAGLFILIIAISLLMK